MYSLQVRHLGWFLLVLAMGICVEANEVGEGFPPGIAAQKMTPLKDFQVELIAAEPFVRQPVAIDFDDRGRLWVLQYLQYPNPAGLKRVKVDRYSRTTYDRIPAPPPRGPKGADRLTILEDTNGDGRMDKAKDFVTGLNLSTGFAFGHGGVYVLQVPYLLFYPDQYQDDIPDSDPMVVLKGFGMEDTSSLVNSLTWGPDGWLYGTQGTNLTARIRGIEFEQGVWRYHPPTDTFELFCEGGGNSWGLDFDQRGNLLYCTNHGGYLMHHGVQGAYLEKYFVKHGELHNPFAFGYFKHVPHENFVGGHVTVGGFFYQGDLYPDEFRGKFVSVDTLGHAVLYHHVHQDRSTFKTSHAGTLADSNDKWFAPSDMTLAPDGSLYIADWHDRRTAHPDPDADWDRTNGRIFRLTYKGAPQNNQVDLPSQSNQQLLKQLSSSNGWMVERSRRILSERRDKTIEPALLKMLNDQDQIQPAREALNVLYATGAFDQELPHELLDHSDDSIRAWTVRYFGDEKALSPRNKYHSLTPAVRMKLIKMSQEEDSLLVLTRLATASQRFPADLAMKIISHLSHRKELNDDPYLPLLMWWAIEKHAVADHETVLSYFAGPNAWKDPFIRTELISRLMRRYAGGGDDIGFACCAQLLNSIAEPQQQQMLLQELNAGLKLIGRERLTALPLGTVFTEIAEKNKRESQERARISSISSVLLRDLVKRWEQQKDDPLLLEILVRFNHPTAEQHVLKLAESSAPPLPIRMAMLQILAELGNDSAAGPALSILTGSDSVELKQSALTLVDRFVTPEIAAKLFELYPTLPTGLQSKLVDVLLGRDFSALILLNAIDRGEYPTSLISVDQLRRLALQQNEEIDALVRKHWGSIQAGTPEEKLAEIRRLNNDLRASEGNEKAGHQLYTKHCGVCHQLYGEGNKIGPDLTQANRSDRLFLLTSIVDPNAQIRKEFLNYVVVTEDGRVVNGLLAEDAENHITLLDAKNQKITIQREEIDEMQASKTSLMPENILKPLKPQELCDLFKYLQSQRLNPPADK